MTVLRPIAANRRRGPCGRRRAWGRPAPAHIFTIAGILPTSRARQLRLCRRLRVAPLSQQLRQLGDVGGDWPN